MCRDVDFEVNESHGNQLCEKPSQGIARDMYHISVKY